MPQRSRARQRRRAADRASVQPMTGLYRGDRSLALPPGGDHAEGGARRHDGRRPPERALRAVGSEAFKSQFTLPTRTTRLPGFIVRASARLGFGQGERGTRNHLRCTSAQGKASKPSQPLRQFAAEATASAVWCEQPAPAPRSRRRARHSSVDRSCGARFREDAHTQGSRRFAPSSGRAQVLEPAA